MKKRSRAKSAVTSPTLVAGPSRNGTVLLPPTTPSALPGVLRHTYDELAPFEVTVPEAWSRHATPETVYPRRCYEKSFHFAGELYYGLDIDDPAARDIWLVHGELYGLFPHAWVEVGGVVFDGVFQRFYARAEYYRTMSARPWYMYSPDAATVIEIRMPRYPDGTVLLANWHEELKLPWADPQEPTRIGLDEAIEHLKRCGLMKSRARSRRAKS